MLEAARDRGKRWDVVVIGGGATGAGCVLDAAARGLNVLLLEKNDFGKGTSSRSTKLVHGGVRYLEQGHVGLVREALRERGNLFKNAPENVRTQEFVVPCFSFWEKFYYGIGLKLYDLLSGRLSLGKSGLVGRATVSSNLPNLDSANLSGGVRYFDGVFDDTELLIRLLDTAVIHGATVLNYTAVTDLVKQDKKTISGVKAVCLETGESLAIQARVVINATGAFADGIRQMSEADAENLLSCSQGVHIVLDKEFLAGNTALMIPKTKDGRVLFAIPFYGKTLVGTTDTPIEIPTEEPTALESEIEFLLETCSTYFSKAPTREDIRSVFTGIRPLVASGDTENTAALSRGHMIEVDHSGLITVTGGKWTTYRNMAEDAINTAVRSGNLSAAAGSTAKINIEEKSEFDGRGLEERLSPMFHWTYADVIRSVRFEMARTVEDVLARRTRILFLDAKEAVRVAPIVAELIATELGRGEEWIESQIASFEDTASNYFVNRLRYSGKSIPSPKSESGSGTP